MLAAVERSGLTESTHDGVVAVAGADGQPIATYGESERSFWLRSAAKPFQAQVALDFGAAMPDEHLALVCSSHLGDPVHIETVRALLKSIGLDEAALKCPMAWPLGGAARESAIASGASPQRIWSDCSGKHAGMLAACVSADLPLETYLDRDHPLQLAIAAAFGELVGAGSGEVGVDGCGAPVLRSNAIGLATAFSKLASDRSRRRVRDVMHRYPRLLSGLGATDAELAVALDVSAKGGAEGVLGIAHNSGIGIAIKVWDGSPRPLAVVALEVLTQLGLLSNWEPQVGSLTNQASLVGRVAGEVRPMFKLEWAS